MYYPLSHPTDVKSFHNIVFFLVFPVFQDNAIFFFHCNSNSAIVLYCMRYLYFWFPKRIVCFNVNYIIIKDRQNTKLLWHSFLLYCYLFYKTDGSFGSKRTSVARN